MISNLCCDNNFCSRSVDGNGAGSSEEQEGDLECSVCAQGFTKIFNLNRHIKDSHTPLEGGVECSKDFCDLIFETRYEMNIHRDGCIFICPLCGYVITRNGRAAGHTKTCNASRGVSDV